jgi:hypothetical protein
MPSLVNCPSCGKQLNVPDELMGKQVRCADCARTFVAEQPRAVAPPPLPVPARSRPDDDFDDDDRPARRKRADYEPHRGGLILALGIISLVVGGIGIVTGIIAWVMGRADLKKIEAGVMDPEGKQTTQIGYIMGMIGAILHGIGLIVACGIFILWIMAIGIFAGSAASKMPPPGAAPRPGNPAPGAPKGPKKFGTLQPFRLQAYLPQHMN